MRSAREHDAVTSIISLGLLATRLQFSLLSTGSNAPLQGNRAVLAQWEDILDETVTFLQSQTKQGVAIASTTTSPRFLARAHYLAQLRSAAPDSNGATPDQLSGYLQKIRENILRLRKGEVLRTAQRDLIFGFVSSIAKGCTQEASKLHQESHPEWIREPALTLNHNARIDHNRP